MGPPYSIWQIAMALFGQNEFSGAGDPQSVDLFIQNNPGQAVFAGDLLGVQNGRVVEQLRNGSLNVHFGILWLCEFISD